MAKIVFIQKLWYETIGVMQLSAVLKAAGHEVHFRMDHGSRKKLVSFVDGLRPDVVAFSILTGQHIQALEIAALLRSQCSWQGFRVVMGGLHPTFVPGIIEDPNVDVICRGEGEGALLELMDRIGRREDFSTVRNLWVKTEGGIVKNPLRPLIADLDSLPFLDRETEYAYRYYRNSPIKSVMASRGCPFKCAYCFNENYGRLNGEENVQVRWRTPENVIKEIVQVTERWKETRCLYFQDDNFILNNKDWLREFCDGYKKAVDMPFMINFRSGMEDEESVRMLVEAGCEAMGFGLETGNEKVRAELLNKRITNDQMRATVRLVRHFKVKLFTNNMFFLPGTTEEDAWETIRLTQELKPDWTSNSIFQPYPGCVMNAKMLASGEIGPDYLSRLDNIYTLSIVRSDHVDVETNIFYFTHLLFRFPGLTPLMRKLAKLKPNPVFLFLYKAMAAFDFITKHRFSLSRLMEEVYLHYDFR